MNTELTNQLTELVGDHFSDQISEILKKYDITRKILPSINSNNKLLDSFLSAKKVEGKSIKTLFLSYSLLLKKI